MAAFINLVAAGCNVALFAATGVTFCLYMAGLSVLFAIFFAAAEM